MWNTNRVPLAVKGEGAIAFRRRVKHLPLVWRLSTYGKSLSFWYDDFQNGMVQPICSRVKLKLVFIDFPV